ncbi:uncharacterized protein K460DRAFT_100437 [Cucurbitaria berberidis CBS 394.84]|uniref:WD40 repeat-like protein n=1 Tax=Cucurbitaria berberidis CBS 394.84 TaxID=1168544 RepID=A0A9P4GGF6_9PLEO|nr:uncharacterized protein K460DRAFT_100437 [Cucurbitaria berberidis CBS 394.84]KAF1844902.1 hypothetical protein K460DRAFT_100437 [Cucurbitaria berberidis CBS 394.84]
MSKHISCIPTGVHLGSRRFPDRNDRPKIKPWRCDLTALSQLYNLYFLACNDTIHVYQPSFPSQKLSKEPELVLHPPISNFATGSGVDPQDPHSITRILVDYLGREEVLLATCDDGDVVGYRIKVIHETLLSLRSTTESVYENRVGPFLHHNVGASAWGLAIHREARIIAYSANTHNITVFAYALAHPGSDSVDSDSCETEPASDFPSPRQKDHVITLTTESNVPSVSFINNGDDPSGRWLISSSIDGKTLIWDLHHPETPAGTQMPARTIQLGWCASAMVPTTAPHLDPGECLCMDHSNYPHGAWGAMMLDTRSAYEMSAADESTLKPHKTAPCFADFTMYKHRFTVKADENYPTPAGFYSYESLTDDDDGNGSSDMMVEDSEMEEAEGSSSNPEGGQNEMPNSNESSDTDSVESFDEEATQGSGVSQGSDMHVEEDTTQGLGVLHGISPSIPDTQLAPTQIATGSPPQSNPQPTLPPHLSGAPPWFFQVLNDNLSAVPWDLDDDSDDVNEPWPMETGDQGQMTYTSVVRLSTKQAYCDITALSTPQLPAQVPSTPCVIVTKDEVFLVQRPFHPFDARDSRDPVLSMRRPLHPGRALLSPNSHDRMCYFSQIPELGVFIVASPLGRAAIFSIYWTTKTGNPLPQYAFKLEYILPFRSRNEKVVSEVGVRGERLVGVAVGPVQGMLDKPQDGEGAVDGESLAQSRRWRLLMYHTDHTVLSFEISRQRASESPALSELVV